MPRGASRPRNFSPDIEDLPAPPDPHYKPQPPSPERAGTDGVKFPQPYLHAAEHFRVRRKLQNTLTGLNNDVVHKEAVDAEIKRLNARITESIKELKGSGGLRSARGGGLGSGVAAYDAAWREMVGSL